MFFAIAADFVLIFSRKQSINQSIHLYTKATDVAVHAYAVFKLAAGAFLFSSVMLRFCLQISLNSSSIFRSLDV